MMDVGPLGYLSIAAHGHADALAVTLSVNGAELIGDPGAGSYYGHPDWRPVHRGTRAHATVCVDGADQSVIGGPFLWSRQATVRVHSVDLVAGVVDAQHDGYLRLPESVVHRRWLVAPPTERSVLIVDLLTGDGTHEAHVSWPLHPTLGRDGQPKLQLTQASTVALRNDDVRGDEASNLGWWSERLESREPAWLRGVRGAGELPIAFATVLTPLDGAPEPVGDLRVELRGQHIMVEWRERDVVRQVSIDVGRPGALKATTTDRR